MREANSSKGCEKMTEKEKMLAGMIYDPSDDELMKIRTAAHELCRKYNLLPESDSEARNAILDKLLPSKGKGAYIQGPVFFDYGLFTSVGDNFYANFNFTVLDCNQITIGDGVMFGPNCCIAAPIHPMDARERRIRLRENGKQYNLEYSKPVVIGNNCWIASNVMICAGVTIGDNCVIGAGSVVVRDIPDDSFAAGNPCRVIRKIAEDDSMLHRPDILGDRYDISE